MNPALLLTALFNGACQGAALCVLALLAFRLFRRLNATTMFAVWSVLLAIAVVLPIANYAFATKPYVMRVSAPQYTGAVSAGERHRFVRDDSVALRYRFGVAQHRVPVAEASRPRIDAAAVIAMVLRYAPVILALLALIALLRLAALVHDVVRMLVARKRVRPIESPVRLPGDIARPFRYAASDEFSSPCVLGFAPPLIVIPEDLLAAQEDAELTSVVLHEREHVRRFDDVQNVLHRLLGALAFFCPGVRIALRELALYREQICDDAAINATGDRVSYAMTLTDLSQWAQGRGAPVPSLIFKRKQLLHRLEVLLDSAVSHSLRTNRRFAFAAVTALVLAAALMLRVQVPVIAQTLASPTRAQEQHMRAQLKQMHTQTKLLHVQEKQLHVRAQELHQQAQHVQQQVVKMHEQVVKMHQQLDAARASLKQMRVPDVHVTMRPIPTTPPVATAPRVPTPAHVRTVASVTTATTVTMASENGSGDLLDALDQAGLRDLSVDELLAIRDHGVTPDLVRAAASYFGHLRAQDLVYLADHGVGPSYIGTLTASGVRGISPHDAATLMDHGVSSQLISAATTYFGRTSADDLTRLADHGVSAPSLEGFRSAGLSGVSVDDIVRLADNGVDARYVAKVRRFNPRASVADIIRLRDAGF